MKKRWIAVGTVAAALLGIGAWFEPSCTVRGYVRGEAFHQNRSTSYWESKLSSDDPMDQAHAPERLRSGDAFPVLVQLTKSSRPSVRWRAADVLGKLDARASASAD